MSTWFVIRADASDVIGSGHVMRCLALAEWAKKYDIEAVLISTELPSSIEERLKQLTVSKVLLSKDTKTLTRAIYTHSHWLTGSEEEDAQCSINVIEKEITKRGCKPSFIVVDHYALGSPWEKKVSALGDILAIDDLCDRKHDCRWLLDQTLGRTADEYVALVNTDCELKTGTKYALLRPEFRSARNKLNRQAPLESCFMRILITLGGMDAENVTGKVVELLSKTTISEKLKVCVVIGGNNSHKLVLEKLIDQVNLDVKLIVNTLDMSSLMLENDLCIGAAGSTSWERCVVGMPSLNIVLADNQNLIAENLDIYGAATNLGGINNINSGLLCKYIAFYHNDSDQYLRAVEVIKSVCDGLGCERILKTILSTCNA